MLRGPADRLSTSAPIVLGGLVTPRNRPISVSIVAYLRCSLKGSNQNPSGEQKCSTYTVTA